jgi:hypothetical protein
MTAPRPEPWLRGPVAGVPPRLQPVAHALVMALEDTERGVEGLSPAELWLRPGGAASVGFHLAHLAGSTERLFTYARGEGLSDLQRTQLAAEADTSEPRPTLGALVASWRAVVDSALGQLANTAESTLLDARGVGRAQLPSNVQGLLFHAAEHAQRHVGQIIATAKIVRGRGPLTSS